MIKFFLIYIICLSYIIPKTFVQKSKTESINRGSEIYEDFCVRCHKRDGLGIENLIPPLKSSDYLLENYDLSIAGLKYGLKGKIIVNGKKYDSYMAYQGLDNEEIADVMNFILNKWGNKSKEIITHKQVSKVTKSILHQ